MFTHTVTIVRPDDTADFFYSATGIFEDPGYVSLYDAAVADGKIANSSFLISGDGMMCTRTVEWDTEQSFLEFFEEFKVTVSPHYESDFALYNDAHMHFASLESATT